jgi:cell division protein FtsZ
MAQEPVPAPDPAPAAPESAPARPATGAKPDPAPAAGPANGASGRSPARRSPAPAPVVRRSQPAPVLQPAVSRRVASVPARVTRPAAAEPRRRPSHRAASRSRRSAASHRRAYRAKPKAIATAAVRPAAAPDFPTIRASLAIAGGRAPDRRLALAGGALLALAVASTGLLALTARDQRRRPRA